jgi:putative transposase
MPTPDTPWPHAPTHRLGSIGAYFVTTRTYQKQHHFRGRDRLAVLHRGLLTVARDHGWQVEAWAVFSNHYHFVAHSPDSEDTAESLRSMLSLLHEKTAKWINKLDCTPERKVWHNYRETKLTYEKSYFARLAYTHRNAVKHGLVLVANQYPWCSAAWFEQNATTSRVETLYRFGDARIRVEDDFEVAPNGESQRLIRPTTCHPRSPSKAVSPLRSATAVQGFARESEATMTLPSCIP